LSDSPESNEQAEGTKIMIEISAIIPWSLEERSTYAAPVLRELHVASPNRRRLVGFYWRVFGFHAVGGRDGARPVVLPATARSDFVVHERAGVQRRMPGMLDRWAFVVADLDQVREAAWDLGIAAVRDSGEPDHIFRWRHGRSLYVRDPDGHEIELLEIWNLARREARRPSQARAA
jgi:hypothetical protein